MLDRSVYVFFDGCAPYLILWLTVFIAASALKIVLRLTGRDLTIFDGLIGSELPGLPLALLHTVCFVKAAWIQDWLSVLLFAWWGPGFLWVAVWYLRVHIKKIEFDWSPYAWPTSIGCKVIYLLLMVVFFRHGLYGIPMVFSFWIMHDQIRLSWFSGNADRTRRVFEDFWIVRVAYAAFLYLPWFVDDPPVRVLSLALGPIMTTLWVAGLYRVIRAGRFRLPPMNPAENLRDIVYLRVTRKR